MKKKILIAVLAVLILMVGAGGVLISQTGAVDAENTETIYVAIEEGSYLSQIADTLEDAGVINSAGVFKIYAKIKGNAEQFKAGTYAFNKAMNMNEIMQAMVDGKTASRSFTVTEGQTIDKVAAQIEAEGVCDQAEFYKEVESGTFDYPFRDQLPEGPTRLEGFLYPDTYQLPLDVTAHEVVDMMLDAFDTTMVEDGIYEAVEADGRDLYTVITEASIVQREAGSVSEYGKVASVIDNRLAIDMPLQMDSIIAYIQKEDKIRATYSDIAVESDYNPYTNKGLPPGPICAPGLDAIKATLSPEDTNYLYFVASPEMDGTNRYSETYEDFLKDKADFDKAYEEYIKDHPDKE